MYLVLWMCRLLLENNLLAYKIFYFVLKRYTKKNQNRFFFVFFGQDFLKTAGLHFWVFNWLFLPSWIQTTELNQ